MHNVTPNLLDLCAWGWYGDTCVLHPRIIAAADEVVTEALAIGGFRVDDFVPEAVRETRIARDGREYPLRDGRRLVTEPASAQETYEGLRPE